MLGVRRNRTDEPSLLPRVHIAKRRSGGLESLEHAEARVPLIEMLRTDELASGKTSGASDYRKSKYLAWFEQLHGHVDTSGPMVVPQADLKPHPSFVRRLERERADGRCRSSLVVGCELVTMSKNRAARAAR